MMRCVLPVLVATFVVASAPVACGHDIPADVRVNAFVKPSSHRLELLVRVPLAAMVDVDFPTRGPGYLDLSCADEAIRRWIAGSSPAMTDSSFLVELS